MQDEPLTPQTPREWAIYAQAAAAFFDHGYQARIDEEVIRPAADSRVLAFGRWYDQALEREKHDTETRALLTGEAA